jgi:hypothetical protein
MSDSEQTGREYYAARQSDFLALLDDHAQAWMPFIVSRYGQAFAETILEEAREQVVALIRVIPYIGGDDNSMTRHLIGATPSLALYKAMRRHGVTARETGRIIYDAVVQRFGQLPFSPAEPPSPDFIQRRREEAGQSQERRYPGDWVWQLVEGDGVTFDYGYDFTECGVQKYYHDHDADEFLPYFCFLDFVTVRPSGQKLIRTTTLAEGGERCDFRLRAAAEDDEWPPPFPSTRGE